MRALIFIISVCLGGFSHGGDWVSPHPLAVEEKAPVALIPFPNEIEWKEGTCPLNVKPVLEKAAPDSVYGKEGYGLTITPTAITVKAAAPAGVFYAKQTLAQLGAKGAYPCCVIKDIPAFGMRGFLHDTGRNFQTIEALKWDLNEMSKFKLNTFQWHLTDHPAWRIECKKYPVLNDPSKRRKNRDVNDTYSYRQIKDLFLFAKARHIQIIPEIDMPGHSEYFKTCFGVTMNSERGMEILEDLLDEFCKEIPLEMCPYIHIGADEVRIPNAKEFIERMSKKLAEHGRKPIQWNGPHDLPVGKDSIAQKWADEQTTGRLNPDEIPTPFYDSTAGYINALDPGLIVRRYFFRQSCGVPKGTDKALGSLACMWPDMRVVDKSNIPLQSAVWPTIMAMAERTWKGLPEDGMQYAANLPERDSEPFKAFASFERRMEALIANRPFPYWRDTFITWQVSAPTPSDKQEEVRSALLAPSSKDSSILTREVIGGNLYLKTRAAQEGIYNKEKPGVTVWAQTKLYSPTARTIYAKIGFDAPSRSTHRASGMPKAGEWSQCGTRIWVNGKEFKNPQSYKLAGQRRYENHTWSPPGSEVPFENEEFWWLRDPVAISLEKGENIVLIEQPFVGDFQSWSISFIPVKKQGSSWIADDSVTHLNRK